ncbi:MAG: hypothetical protein Q8M16_15055, partial [Pirellulaceae bacterium]|nr:hypothetical protein [Pirellulaceae bacterium]
MAASMKWSCGNNNNDPNSDASQTQYCCLALWLAYQKSIDIPLDHSIKAVEFWVNHQFHDGTWAYRPIPNQPAGSPHVSLAAAGCGSLYMLGDILGVNPSRKRLFLRESGASIAELPAFVERLTPREVEDLLAVQNNGAESAVELAVNVDGLNAAKRRINGWFAKSFHTETSHCPFDALYGFERYAAFREMIDGEVTEVPDWYDQGVEFIKRT